MTTILGIMSGDVPEPEGLMSAELGEFNPGTLDGDVPEPEGLMSGTVRTSGTITPFVTLRDDALDGLKFIDKGPGFLIAGASKRHVVLIDATGFRSVRLESVSIELDGDVQSMQTTADFIFVYVLDKQVLKRRLYVLENLSGLAIVATIDTDDGELSGWLSVKEDAGVFAIPVGVGRVQVRSITSPFAVISEVQGIGRSAVATWVDLPEVIKDPQVIQPPDDYENFWDMSAYTTSIGDSYMLPRQVIPDTVGSVDLTVTNPKSNGADIARVVRIEQGCAAPDGQGGLYFVEMFVPLGGELSEIVRLESAAPIDFNTDGAYSIGGWINPSFVGINPATLMKQTLVSQGASAAVGMRVFVEVEKIAATGNEATIEFHTNFATSGSEMISYVVPGDSHEWHFVRVQQDATTMEIWVDGLLVASSAPVGASGINILNNTNFNLGGDTNVTGNTIDWMGGMGRDWTHYSRKLDASENLAWHDSADNFDFSARGVIIDDGTFGEELSNNTFPQWTWGVDRKTVAITIANTWNLVCTPISRTSPPVEIQFRANSTSTGWLVGMSARLGLFGGVVYLGQQDASWGFDWSDRRVVTNSVFSGTPGAALGTGDVVTLRFTPSTLKQEWLVNNVPQFTQTIPFDWDLERSFRFAVGNRSTVSGTMEILTDPSELVYPVGTGFTTVDMI